MKTRFTLTVALLAGALGLFTGCQSTPAQRIAQQKNEFAAMPEEVQAKIRRGEIAVGFTTAQVKLARGEPDQTSQRTTKDGTEVVWTYLRKSSGLSLGLGIGGGSGGTSGGVGVSTGGRSPAVDLRVIFAAGVVTAIDRFER